MFRNGIMCGKRVGFSLIELMVVVAILSIAAALLVPRFLKQRAPEQAPAAAAEVSKSPE